MTNTEWVLTLVKTNGTARTIVYGVLFSILAAACSDDPIDQEKGIDSVESRKIYVTLAGPSEVAVIDEGSYSVLQTISVGRGPAIILATPGAEKLYTADWASDTVSAVDTVSNEVKTISTPGRPYVIAMNPSGERIYVGTYPIGISMIDTDSDEIVDTIETDELAASLILSSDGEVLYVATLEDYQSPGTLRAISAVDGSLIHAPIEVGVAPAWITISHDGSQIYTLNFRSDDITVVDTKSFTVVDTIDTGEGSRAIIGNVCPDDSALWVTNHGTGTLVAIDRATNTISKTIELGGRPVGVEFNADGSQVYVTDYGDGSLEQSSNTDFLLTGIYENTIPGRVRIFDTTTGEQIGETIAVGPGPTSVVVGNGTSL